MHRTRLTIRPGTPNGPGSPSSPWADRIREINKRCNSFWQNCGAAGGRQTWNDRMCFYILFTNVFPLLVSWVMCFSAHLCIVSEHLALHLIYPAATWQAYILSKLWVQWRVGWNTAQWLSFRLISFLYEWKTMNSAKWKVPTSLWRWRIGPGGGPLRLANHNAALIPTLN